MLQPHYLGSSTRVSSAFDSPVPLPSTGALSPTEIPELSLHLPLGQFPSAESWQLSSISSFHTMFCWFFTSVSLSSLNSQLHCCPTAPDKFFDSQDGSGSSAASVSLLLPPSIVASLLHEGCQLCPPVRVVLHVPCRQLLLLHLQAPACSIHIPWPVSIN